MDIEQRIKRIIVDQLGVKPEQVTITADLVRDLGVDSLDTVELVMAIEEEFGFEIQDEAAERLKTVGDIVDYVNKKLAEDKKSR